MKKEHKRRLDILSEIDEDIIEKHTEKRYELMSASKRNRSPKWVILVAACLALLLAAGAFIILPKLLGNGSGRQVPVYQGMTISSDGTGSGKDSAARQSDALSYMSTYRAEEYSLNIQLLASEIENDNNGNGNNGNPNGDNGNHNGHDKKPIEEIVEDSLKVEGAAETIYYANPNEDIYITVHVSNPDNFEILSFTLNGKVYSSYMFEDGSDMENLILKYPVGEVEGVVEYTIDAIKYIDGIEIKDVVMAGDKTVLCGVYSEKQPAPEVTNEVVGINKLTFTATVSDPLNLIGISGGKVMAVLSDGTDIIAEQELTVGEETQVVFDGLATDTLYQYAIVAAYDPLDGNGFAPSVLWEREIRTKAVVAFDNVTVTQGLISFGYAWNPDFADKTLTSVELYHKGVKIRDIATDVTSITDLLSDNAYSLVISYLNNGATETVTLDFTTKAKAVPTVTLTKGEVTQSSLGFAIDYTDTDAVGAITKIELLHGEDAPIVVGNLELRTFETLLSNNDYTVRVTVTYDLNDGTGAHEISKSLALHTKAKAVPSVSLTKGEVTHSALTFALEYSDIDSVGVITKIELLRGEDTPIVAGSLDQRTFDKLLSDNDYTLRVTVSYDLNDGTGAHEISDSLALHTEAKTAPSVTFPEMNATKYKVTGCYDLTDPDGILLGKTVALYQGESMVATTKSEGELIFSGLADYTDYTVKITYTYDLNDGKGVQTAEKSHAIKTMPHIDATSVSVRNTSALFEGETIYLQAELDNPHNAKVTAVTVNGTSYAVTATSTGTSVFAEIVVGDQFGGGEVALTVDAITLTLDNKSYTVACDTRLSDEVFINGKFEFVGWDFVNAAYEPVYALIPGEETYFRLKLNNPTDYTIHTLTLNGDKVLKGSNFIKLDRNTYLCPVEYVALDEYDWSNPEVYDGVIVLRYGSYEYEQNYIQLVDLAYGNEYVDNTLKFGKNEREFYVLQSDEIRYISSVEDLYRMDEDIRYELTCDIDLDGIEWKSVEFRGMLNGNGYAIRNMSFVGTVKGTDSEPWINLGLFSEATGVIENLHIKNATMIVTASADFVTYGAIAANARSTLVVKNCTVDAASTVGIKAADCVAGGIVGYGSTLLQNCTNESTISVTTEGKNRPNVRVGGICGHGNAGLLVQSCDNYGDITVSILSLESPYVSVGGIIGFVEEGGCVSVCENHGTVRGETVSSVITFNFGGIVGSLENGTVSNCLNNGYISSTFWTGGIVGGAIGSDSLIENCLNTGKVENTHTYPSAGILADYEGWVDGVYDWENAAVHGCVNVGEIVKKNNGNKIGIAPLDVNIEDCYATELYQSEGSKVTLEELKDAAFWRDTLGWDETIWNFDDLDPANGKYPTLCGISDQ